MDGIFSCFVQSHLCVDFTFSLWVKLNSADPCDGANGIISARMIMSGGATASEGFQFYCIPPVATVKKWRYGTF